MQSGHCEVRFFRGWFTICNDFREIFSSVSSMIFANLREKDRKYDNEKMEKVGIE